MPLSSEEARKVIAAAHEQAAQLGIRVAVAIVDEGGLLMALLRMDGAMPLSAQVAEAKANGAALTLRDGGSLAQLAQERPGFFAVADRLTRMPLVPGLGSLVIRRGGAVLGAVGVSGGKPEQDLECAEAGLKSM
jgi:uncharacterized protein GlcG (DUF336 family)